MQRDKSRLEKIIFVVKDLSWICIGYYEAVHAYCLGAAVIRLSHRNLLAEAGWSLIGAFCWQNKFSIRPDFFWS